MFCPSVICFRGYRRNINSNSTVTEQMIPCTVFSHTGDCLYLCYICLLGVKSRYPLFPIAENTADHIENSVHDQGNADEHPQNCGGTEGVSNDRNTADNGDSCADCHPKPFTALHTNDINGPLQLRNACNQDHHTVHQCQNRECSDKLTGIESAKSTSQ